MNHFEELVTTKLNHIIEKIDGVALKVEDHESRIRVLERFKYSLMAAVTSAGAAAAAAGHKIGEWLGLSSQ